MSNRILLIDGDVLAYRTAAAKEKAIEWEDGFYTWHVDEYEVRSQIELELDFLLDKLDADEYRLCLTDSEANFRKKLLPSYKSNRTSQKKPLVLKAIRQWMIEDLNAILRPGLEGDDCLGILATWPKLKGEKVIYSVDKDMKTVPGLYCRDLNTGIVEVSEQEADYWHLFQTLTGDQTDGYSGCPGVGPKKAEAILKTTAPEYAGEAYVPYLWEQVSKAFTKAGLNEAEALTQARVARVLRASDYDFKKKEPILWTPPN